MIRLKQIHKSYGTGTGSLHVIKGIDLEIEKGELISIMGPSGSGKSTLLNIMGILDSYDSGRYYLDDILIETMSETKAAVFRNKHIGFVFQSFNLIPFKNAAENVALPLYYQGIVRRKRNKIAMGYLERMRLKEWAGHMPYQLSNGQQQRVAIARALASKPEIILADEPTGALDSATSCEMMDIFREINESGITVVIITHEHDIAGMTDRILKLYDGVIEDDIDNRDRHYSSMN